jgi:acyl-CoA thioesterase-2
VTTTGHDAADLVDLLDLTPAGPGRFTGRSAALGLPQLFGGQLVAQSLVAAGRTVDGRSPHSLHAHFLRPGRPDVPLEFGVETLRDGRVLATRQVTVRQDGRIICQAVVSFAGTMDGPRHSRAAGPVPPAEHLPPLSEVAARYGGLGPVWDGFLSVDVRLPNAPASPPPERPGSTGTARPAQAADPIWMRVAGRLPDDPVAHAAGLLYMSDLMLISASVAAHGYRLGHERAFDEHWVAVSLDHAVWFHAPARADEWLLFEQVSPVAGDGRALTQAAVYDAAGTAVATVAQEALVTPRA